MTVVMAPGPAKRGIPNGTTPTSSFSEASSASSSVILDLVSCPLVMVKAIENRRMPPAILNAGIVIPYRSKMTLPKRAKTTRTLPATMQTLLRTLRFSSGE